MEELYNLSVGLLNSSTLLLRRQGHLLECLFLREGLVCHVVPVKCQILAAALLQESVAGVLEGAAYTAFKFRFEQFSLRVKARRLYGELCMPPFYSPREPQTLAVA
ncbi:hypothetical protein [Pontibacter russatus]|uniref:hypothetical protein n=1 Tax=Pontibacter russatus TaxID=2694929 RepID=UPI00137B20EE|nr:hypothetical protein [Pontibacter russatus]